MSLTFCQITVPSVQEQEDIIEVGKTYTVYNINLIHTASGRSKSCSRRFHEFREFDRVWSELYPTVSERVKLPSSFAPIQTSGVIDKRRRKLEEYLTSLSEVKAIQPLLAQFLGVSEDWVCAPKGKPQENLPDLHVEKWRGMEDAKGKIHGLGRETQKASDAQHHGLVAIERDGETYYIAGQTQSTVAFDDMKVSKKEMRGNTHDASERARREKEAFLKKNAGVIASLMPGRNLNFTYNVDRAGESNDRYMGKVLISLWFRAGTGGNVRPVLKDDDFEDVGGGAIVVEVHSGMDLPSYDGITNPYCKLYLLPDPLKLSKRKTAAKNRTVNPEWEEMFEYGGIYPSELPVHRLIVSIWDRRLNGKNSCVGEVCLTDLGNLPTNPKDRLSRWVELRAWSNFSTPESQGVSITAMKSNQHDAMSPRSTNKSPFSPPTPSAQPKPLAPPATTTTSAPSQPTAPPPKLPSKPPPKLGGARPTSADVAPPLSQQSTPTPSPSPSPALPAPAPRPAPAPAPAPAFTPKPAPPPITPSAQSSPPQSAIAPVSSGGGSLQEMLAKRKAEMDSNKAANPTPASPSPSPTPAPKPQLPPQPTAAPAFTRPASAAANVAALPPRPVSSNPSQSTSPPAPTATPAPPFARPQVTPQPSAIATPSSTPTPPKPAPGPSLEEMIAKRKAQVDAATSTPASPTPTPTPASPPQSSAGAPPPMPKASNGPPSMPSAPKPPATPSAAPQPTSPPATPVPETTSSPAIPSRRPAPTPGPAASNATKPDFSQFAQFNKTPASPGPPAPPAAPSAARASPAPPPLNNAKVSLQQTTHAPAFQAAPVQAAAPQITQSPVAEQAAPPPRPGILQQQKDRFIVESEYSPSNEEIAASQLLPLKVGEIVTTIDKNDPGWWYGRVAGREGYFPASFVKPC